jgi:hypothetical protein
MWEQFRKVPFFSLQLKNAAFLTLKGAYYFILPHFSREINA